MMEKVGLDPAWINRYPARILRRPESARRHRARDDSAAEAGDLRRSGQRARRFNSGADRGFAALASARIRHVADFHQPRSLGGAPSFASRDGALSRARGGDRFARCDLSRSAPSLHQGADLGGADSRSDRRARKTPSHAARGIALAARHALAADVPEIQAHRRSGCGAIQTQASRSGARAISSPNTIPLP